jgi:hypothetical protein
MVSESKSQLMRCGDRFRWGMNTHSEVISTRHSQSCTRSRKDSAEKPAKTVEWIAPILAQAKNAAAACLQHRN